MVRNVPLAMYRLGTQLWQRHRPAVLPGTHDVDEVTLADRVLVLESGRIAAEHGVGLVRMAPGPRWWAATPRSPT